jgi:hypothetical protein
MTEAIPAAGEEFGKTPRHLLLSCNHSHAKFKLVNWGLPEFYNGRDAGHKCDVSCGKQVIDTTDLDEEQINGVRKILSYGGYA